jgi:hypothetical protein
VCQGCGGDFIVDSDDLAFYEKINVPLPTFCWLCRVERRFQFRNERNLYKRTCGSSGKEIFSMYPPELPVQVYEKDVWLSDAWDATTYGVDVDFSRPFFEQVRDLWRRVPLKNLNLVNAVETEFANHFTNPKRCYLTFNGNNSEECMYGNGITQCRDCVDVSHMAKCEDCYESFWLTGCTRAFYSSNCENSFDIAFCKNCAGCSSCFGCVGLRNKQYYILNVPYSKEEYEKHVAAFEWRRFENLARIRAEAAAFWMRFPNRYLEGLHNTNVSGNYIDHSKNVRQSFLIRDGENIRYSQYMQELPGSKDCYDFSIWGDNNQLAYEAVACGIGTYNIRFCLFVQEDVRNIEYSVLCSGSSDLFGCVGIRKKQYCILNKEYSKEEYEALVPKIRKHMMDVPYVDAKGRTYRYGEFFPPEFSPWAFNETIAFDYFPRSQADAEAKGLRWRPVESRSYEVTLETAALPATIAETDDSILSAVIRCAHGGTCMHQCPGAFKVTPQELQFYRRHGLPVPRLCPICRHYERLSQRSKLQVYPRQCGCGGKISSDGAYTNAGIHHHGEAACSNQFETCYAPDRKDIVYCEQCYQAEVV